MTSTWKAALGIFLVFVFGCLSGGLSTSLFLRHEVLMLERHPSEVADILENRLTHHLGIDPGQHRQIHDVLMTYLQQRQDLLQQVQPQMQVLNQQMVGQIRAVLRPEQVAGFHENVEQLRRRLASSAFHPPGAEVGAPEATNAAPVQ